MSPKGQWQKDVIAVWQRDQDGLQFCFRRDGMSRFRHGSDSGFLPGSEAMGFDAAIKWAYDHGFRRLQKVD